MVDCSNKTGHREWREAPGDINDELIIHLRDLSHTMRSMYEGRGSQKRVLMVLDEIGGSMTQRELTERLGIQPGSASEVIAKLESGGCVQRFPNETDRRTVQITLTETGKELAGDARKRRAHRHAQMFSCLSREEKEQLLALLEKVNRDWKERYAGMGENQEGHCRQRERC